MNQVTATNEELIDLCRDIAGQRIADPVTSGKWVVFRVTVSDTTFGKFASRIRDAFHKFGVKTFHREKRFGFLSQEV